MAAKLTALTHKIAIQLHLVAESCTVRSSRCRRPVRKVLDTPSYTTFLRLVIEVSPCSQFSLTCTADLTAVAIWTRSIFLLSSTPPHLKLYKILLIGRNGKDLTSPPSQSVTPFPSQCHSCICHPYACLSKCLCVTRGEFLHIVMSPTPFFETATESQGDQKHVLIFLKPNWLYFNCRGFTRVYPKVSGPSRLRNKQQK
jgi:hypothetical protein